MKMAGIYSPPKAGSPDFSSKFRFKTVDNNPRKDPLYDRSQFKVYPQLARTLREDDIGKLVLRVLPTSRGDWSFVINHDESESSILNGRAHKLESLKEKTVIIDYKPLTSIEAINDNSWCTAEEFLAYRKLHPNDCVPFEKVEKLSSIGSTSQESKHAPDFFEPIEFPPSKNPGHSDYSFHPPHEESSEEMLATHQPNFSSTDPYEILGIDPQEKNLDVIRKQYKKLALLHHPDRGGSEENFKKLVGALRKIEGNTRPFVFNPDADLSTLFLEARQHFFQFEGNLVFSTAKIQEKIPQVSKFLGELLKVDLSKGTDEALKLHFKQCIQQATSLLHFYRIKLKLSQIQLPKSCLEVTERIKLLRSNLREVTEINLDGPFWNFCSLNLFRSAHFGVLDKYIATARCLHELLLSEGKTLEAKLFRDEIKAFAENRKINLDEKILDLKWKETLFGYEVSKHNEKKSEDERPQEAPSPKQKTSQPPKQPPEGTLTFYEKPKERPEALTLQKEIECLQQNIKKNGLYQTTHLHPHVPSIKVESMLSEVLGKAFVQLPQGPCTYLQNTNDFGVQIQELLVTGSDPQYTEHSKQMRKDILAVAKQLGIKCTEQGVGYFVRDFFLQNNKGQIMGPMNVPSDQKTVLETAIKRAISKEEYANTLGASKSPNRSLHSSLGYPATLAPLVIDEAKSFLSESKASYSPFYFEGGNIFTVTNSKNETKVLCGRPHLLIALHWLRQNNVPIPKEQLEKKLQDLENLSPPEKLASKVNRVAEKMYSQGILKQGDKTGLIDEYSLSFEQLMKIVQTMGEEHCTLADALFKLGYLKRFDANHSDLKIYKELVAKYLCQKDMAKKLIADAMNVKVDDVVYLPLVGIHLDLFLRPAMKNGVFLADFKLVQDICQTILNCAEALHLDNADKAHLSRYILSAQKAHEALHPLLDEARKKLERAGFKVIPMPGLFTYDSNPGEESYNFNLMNAVSGWSEVTKKYYYIVGGVEVGNLGPLFMDTLKAFLEQYDPNLELYFVGKDPDSSKFVEPMKIMNTLGKSYGNVHCLTFEKSTATHQESLDPFLRV